MLPAGMCSRTFFSKNFRFHLQVAYVLLQEKKKKPIVKNGEKLQCSMEMLKVTFQCMFFKLGHKYTLLYANTHLLSSLRVCPDHPDTPKNSGGCSWWSKPALSMNRIHYENSTGSKQVSFIQLLQHQHCLFLLQYGKPNNVKAICMQF